MENHIHCINCSSILEKEKCSYSNVETIENKAVRVEYKVYICDKCFHFNIVKKSELEGKIIFETKSMTIKDIFNVVKVV
jgi:hypothetical protein